MEPPTWTNIADDLSELSDLTSDSEDEHEDEITQIDPLFQPNSTIPTNQGYISTRPSTRQATQKSSVGDRLIKKNIHCEGPQRFTTSTFLDQVKSGELDLNPDYQRGVVWTDDKQSKLIESLIHKYHVPPLLLCNFTEGERSGTSTCIDGKQRITSICRFLNGEIPVVLEVDTPSGPKTRKYWMRKDAAHKGRRLLPGDIATAFRKIPITFIAYENLSPEIEREMFQRVQLGMSLKPSDRLGAINGSWGEMMRDLHAHIISTPGFEGYLDWGAERGKDYQALAQIIYLAVHGATPRKAEPTPVRIEAFLSNQEGDPSRFRNRVFSSMDTFCRIASNPALNDPLTKDVAPLEFVLSVYLIIRHHTQLRDSQISEAIRLLRNHAKGRKKAGKVVDTTRFKALLSFIHKSVEVHRLKGELDAGLVADEGLEFQVNSQQPAYVAPQIARRTKRNKTQQELDSDDDYVIPKKRTKTSDNVPAVATRPILKSRIGPSRAKTTIKKPSPEGIQSHTLHKPRATVNFEDVRPIIPSGSASCVLPQDLKFNKSSTVALSASGSTSKKQNINIIRTRSATSSKYTPPSSPQNSEETDAPEPPRRLPSIAERTSEVLSANNAGKEKLSSQSIQVEQTRSFRSNQG